LELIRRNKVNDIDKKKLIITRIIAHLNPVPENCVQELLGQSLEDLQVILDKLATTRDQEQVEEVALARSQEMIRQSKADHVWAYVLCKVSLNGKRLAECDANREILEGMLQPHEESSPALYETILKQFSNKFSWAVPQPIKSAADREAEVAKICRENNLSECDANRQFHKDGTGIEHWAGASQVELQRFQVEAAQVRQTFLIKHATPSELKAEAKFQSATERDIFLKAEADRAQQFVLSQQGHYPPLPQANEAGEVIDAQYLRKISTINLPLFRALIKKHGSGHLTARLRGE
jgi:hypothetical protein